MRQFAVKHLRRAAGLLVLSTVALGNAPGLRGQNWGTPVWSDEFNGALGTPIDKTKWTYDTGILNVNDEVEYYCSPDMMTGGCDPQNPNAYIDGNGNLIIQAIKVGSSTAPFSGSWTSARLKTQGLEEFQYGRVEARMSLPTVAPGIWPAFWALGSNIGSIGWPNCGEADYMENVPASGGLGPTKIASSLHQGGTSGEIDRTADYTFSSGDVTRLHIYGAIWSPNMIQFYVDDPTNVFYVQTANDIGAGQTWGFNHPFFLLLNLAIGGVGSWPGAFDATTPNPSVMTVDYVRIYQAAAVPAPTMGNPMGITVKAGATSGNTSSVSVEDTLGSGRVYFVCRTTAPQASCQVNTDDLLNANTVDFSATAAGTVTVSVTTTANALLLPPGPGWRMFDGARFALAALAAVLLLGFAAKWRGRASRPGYALGGILLLCGGLWLACSSGGGSTLTPPPSNGTTPGSYTIALNAYTLTGTGTTPDATVNIPLTVN
jgi:beta-glucanase (GH16 family)